MIARPKISRNEWKTTEIGAFEALVSRPVGNAPTDPSTRPKIVTTRMSAGLQKGRAARGSAAPQAPHLAPRVGAPLPAPQAGQTWAAQW